MLVLARRSRFIQDSRLVLRSFPLTRASLMRELSPLGVRGIARLRDSVTRLFRRAEIKARARCESSRIESARATSASVRSRPDPLSFSRATQTAVMFACNSLI
jgi:hypothetical protein